MFLLDRQVPGRGWGVVVCRQIPLSTSAVPGEFGARIIEGLVQFPGGT
jgi:hypothetical protein